MHSAPAVDERLVVRLWERQAFPREALDALGFSVVFRGLPSDAGGPDYQDALLARGDRTLLAGDVEFHVRSSDWYRHGHQLDPSYDRVVLHVVWIDDDPLTRRSDGMLVPVLELHDCVSPSETDAASSHPFLLGHPCVPAFARLSDEELRARVRRAGEMRLEERSQRIAAEMTAVTPDQVAYTALLEGMGYASNRDAFRRLAEAVPLAWLWSVSPDRWAAILLDAAGLAPGGDCDPPGRLTGREWRITRLRPGNHPALRIRGVAALLARLGPRPSDRLLNAVLEARRPTTLRALLVVRQGGETFIGPGRADEIAVSVVLPLASALEPQLSAPADLLHRYPSPPSTRWTRIMQDLLAKAGHDFAPRSAAEHQGLHHLYHAFCRPERHAGCPVCGATGRLSPE